jgi:hypothetical protein
MDKPSKRKPAKPSLTSKEAMETELNRKLPKSTWVPDQPAPLEQLKVFTLPIGDLGTAAPSYDGTSKVAASSGVYPDEGYDYGDRYGAIRPPASTAHRWTTKKLTRGPTIDTISIITLRRRLGMWMRTRCLTATPTHEAKAFVRPTTSHRERAKRHRRSTAWSASWRGWSATLLPLQSNFKRFLARVSCFLLFR